MNEMKLMLIVKLTNNKIYKNYNMKEINTIHRARANELNN